MKAKDTYFSRKHSWDGTVRYGHATSYHLTEHTTNAFEQRQGRKIRRIRLCICIIHVHIHVHRHDTARRPTSEEERKTLVLPCYLDDDEDDVVFLIEKEGNWGR